MSTPIREITTIPLGQSGYQGEVQDTFWPGSMRYCWAVRDQDGITIQSGYCSSLSEVITQLMKWVGQ